MSTTDLYGFPITITDVQKEALAICDSNAEAAQPIWMTYIEKDRLPHSDSKIKDMIRKGIPPTCRTWVWMEVSGASRKKASVAGNYYSIMVTSGEKSPCMPDIEEDCKGVFPSHPWLNSADGQTALKRVLSAYSIHNDKVGYCRAMSTIVAILLVAMNRNEENAFWLLSALVEDTLYPGTYSRNLQGCKIEMKALDELILEKLPRLHAHLQKTMCDINIIATDWYLGLFSTSLPSEVVVRIWDALFNEGPKILYRVALALLLIEEETLLKCDNAGDIVLNMREFTGRVHNRDKLMGVAFDGIGSLPMATIDKFREMRAREFAAEGGGQVPESSATGSSGSGGAAVKAGFGKFMTGLDKWANKTADSMAKQMEKVGIKDN